MLKYRIDHKNNINVNIFRILQLSFEVNLKNDFVKYQYLV